MADQLITGTTLVEKERASSGDSPIGTIIEWDDTFASIPVGWHFCDGLTINDPLSSYNGSTVPDYNTEFMSINYAQFHAQNPDTDDITYQPAHVLASADGITLRAAVNFPNGATVAACTVYGAAAGETWSLYQTDFVDGVTTMASEAIGTVENTITDPVIDNTTYSYFLKTSTIDTGDKIYGAELSYTPRQKFIIRIK